MKKVFSLITFLIVTSAAMAQINFKFKFLNSSNTVLTTTASYTSSATNPLIRIDVDLTSSVCEGDFIKISNLTNGTYYSSSTTISNIDHSTYWDAAWGWWGKTSQGSIAWGGKSYAFNDKQWDKPDPANYLNYIPQDLQIPVNDEYVGNSFSYVISPYTYNVNIGTTIGGNYDPNFVTYALLVSPLLQNEYKDIDLTAVPVSHQNINCARIVVLVIKVKRAPKPIANQTICVGQPVNITIPSGVTATNWLPSNPTITPPTTTTTYSVSLSNGACAIVSNFTITVNGTPLLPQIQGNSTFCSGQPLTFLGTATTNEVYGDQWEIIECSATGTPIGSTLHNSGPGYTLNTNFTFPISTICGKYYKIKYTVNGASLDGACPLTSFVEKQIYIACNPIVSFDGITTICQGSSTTLCASVPSGSTIIWKFGRAIYTTSCITISPLASITGQVTVTNQNGCSSTAAIPITVVNNDPAFSTFVNTTNLSYFTVDITANDGNAYNNQGFYYSLFVQELDGNLNPYYTDGGTDAWWYFPTNSFRGFVSTGTGTYTQTPWSYTPTPSAGQFLYNHTYKITRETWNAVCTQHKQFWTIVAPGRSFNGSPSVVVTEGVVEDVNENSVVAASVHNNTPNDQLSIYPNPSSGIFTIEMSNDSKASIEVYDALGKKVKSFEQTGFKSALDLNNYPKGMYMINIISEGKQISKKIILE